MDNNRNRGNGIFLGIVSIATLIVAIIGATFAYFSVTATSAEDAVQLGAYEFNAAIDVETIFPADESKALIPLNASYEIPDERGILNDFNKTNLLYAINIGGNGIVGGNAGNFCVDDSGFQVCAMLKVTIHNYGFQPITLSGQLKTILNMANPMVAGATPFTHLTYQNISGAIGEYETSPNSFQLVGSPILINQDPSVDNGITNLGNEVTIAAATKVTGGETTAGETVLYLLIYLAEAKDENGNPIDQSVEMGAQYQGQLIFSTSDDANRLTGTFTLRTSESEEEPEVEPEP